MCGARGMSRATEKPPWRVPCAALRPPVVPAQFGAAFGGKITASLRGARPALRTLRGIGLARLLLAGAASPRRSAPHSASVRRARRKSIAPSGIRGRKATPGRPRAPSKTLTQEGLPPPRPPQPRGRIRAPAAQPRATISPWPASRPIQQQQPPRPPCLGGGGRRNKTTAGHRITRAACRGKIREPPVRSTAPANTPRRP